MASPARAAHLFARKPRRDIAGDHCGFDQKRARAAHGFDERRTGRGERRPARPQQNSRREIFLERRRALARAIAAPMQALAREIDRDLGLIAIQIDIDAHIWVVRIHIWPLALCIPHLIDNRILGPLRDELAVGELRTAHHRIDGECAIDLQMRRPVDRADSCVEGGRICRREAREDQQHSIGDPRP